MISITSKALIMSDIKIIFSIIWLFVLANIIKLEQTDINYLYEQLVGVNAYIQSANGKDPAKNNGLITSYQGKPYYSKLTLTPPPTFYQSTAIPITKSMSVIELIVRST